MKKEVPFILTLVFAFGRILLESVYSLEALKVGTLRLLDVIGIAIAYLQAMALLMGAVNLARIHGNTVRNRRANWGFSLYLLAVLFTYMVYGLAKGNSDYWYNWVFNGVYKPLDATMFSLIAFFIASAAYRAFKVRSVEAGLMMLVAIVVMLAQVPVGEAMWGRTGLWGGFPGISDWILAVPNAASGRAISLGIFLGVMATQTRVLLGIEKRHLGQD